MKIFRSSIKTILLATCFIFTFAQNATPPTTTKTQEAKDFLISIPKELISLKLSNPVFLFVTTHFVKLFLHEWGHGLMSMAFDPDSFNCVHFLCKMDGPNRFAVHRPLIDFDKLKIHCNGILASAHVNYCLEKTYQQLLYFLAGPLTGLLLCHSILYAINMHVHYSNNRSILQAAKNSLFSLYSPLNTILNAKKLSFSAKRFLINLSFVISFFTIEELFYGFTPNIYGLAGLIQDSGGNSRGDGRVIWEDFIVDNNQSHWFRGISIASAILEWGSYGFLLFQYAKALKSLNQQEQIQTASSQPQ